MKKCKEIERKENPYQSLQVKEKSLTFRKMESSGNEQEIQS